MADILGPPTEGVSTPPQSDLSTEIEAVAAGGPSTETTWILSPRLFRQLVAGERPWTTSEVGVVADALGIDTREMWPEVELTKGVRPRHLRGHATFGDDVSGWCGCAGCDPREDCACQECREIFPPELTERPGGAA